jgi:anti-sigma-K factor RskA
VSPERSHNELQELLGVYALDATSDEERGAVEGHLAECPRCRAEVSEHLETAALLAAAGARAPDGVWDAISEQLDERPAAVSGLEEVRAERPERDRRQPWRWVSAAVAAAAVAAAVSLGVAVTEQHRRIEELAAGVEDAGIVRAANAALLREDARRLTLTSPDGAVRVEAVILPDGRGYLVEDNLRHLPAGRTYQLWALGGEQPISAGVLGADPRILPFAVDPQTTGLAITAERAGGVVASRNPPVAAGEVRTV